MISVCRFSCRLFYFEFSTKAFLGTWFLAGPAGFPLLCDWPFETFFHFLKFEKLKNFGNYPPFPHLLLVVYNSKILNKYEGNTRWFPFRYLVLNCGSPILPRKIMCYNIYYISGRRGKNEWWAKRTSSEQSQKIKQKCQKNAKSKRIPVLLDFLIFFSRDSVLVTERITLGGGGHFLMPFFLAFTPCFRDSGRVNGFGGWEQFCCAFSIPQIAVSLRKILCFNVTEFLFVHSFARIARKKRGLLSWWVLTSQIFGFKHMNAINFVPSIEPLLNEGMHIRSTVLPTVLLTVLEWFLDIVVVWRERIMAQSERNWCHAAEWPHQRVSPLTPTALTIRFRSISYHSWWPWLGRTYENVARKCQSGFWYFSWVRSSFSQSQGNRFYLPRESFSSF